MRKGNYYEHLQLHSNVLNIPLEHLSNRLVTCSKTLTVGHLSNRIATYLNPSGCLSNALKTTYYRSPQQLLSNMLKIPMMPYQLLSNMLKSTYSKSPQQPHRNMLKISQDALVTAQVTLATCLNPLTVGHLSNCIATCLKLSRCLSNSLVTCSKALTAGHLSNLLATYLRSLRMTLQPLSNLLKSVCSMGYFFSVFFCQAKNIFIHNRYICAMQAYHSQEKMKKIDSI